MNEFSQSIAIMNKQMNEINKNKRTNWMNAIKTNEYSLKWDK